MRLENSFLITICNPLQPVIRLYAVPLAAFTGEDEDEEGFEEDQEDLGI